MIDWGGNDSPSRRNMGPLPKTGEWVRLEVAAEHVGLKAGSIVKGWAFTQFDGTTYWDKSGVNTVTPQEGGSFESLLAWEALQKAIKDSTLPKAVQEALAVESTKRTPEQQKPLVDYFVEHVYAKTKPTFDDLHAQRKKVQDQLAELDKQVPTSMILEDMPQRKDAFLLIRGQYDQKGDKVLPGTPASLPPMASLAEGQPLNRLALAKWLVQPDHPLTARVAVNRYWQQYFGTGLVETSEDFGAQGQWPSHPELLDWLATEFIASGWDVKHLQRLIVTSATYRQSAKVTPESFQKDRGNRLLSRGPRFRLDAEVIRDTALFTSGLLVEKVGGRSVKPYQPSGLWEAIGFTGSNTANFVQDHGEALYRRSVYTFWKRTSPPPSLSIFDAPLAGSVRRPPQPDEYADARACPDERCPVRRSVPGVWPADPQGRRRLGRSEAGLCLSLCRVPSAEARRAGRAHPRLAAALGRLPGRPGSREEARERGRGPAR